MNRFSKFMVIGLMLALVAMLIAPVTAQDEEMPGPGEGGIIFVSNTSDDPSVLNPLLGGDTTSSAVYGRMYPSVLGVNPFTGALEPNYQQTLATGWEFDETGTVLTVTLREDAFWSDGVQITANDYLWGAEALRSGLVDSPRSQMWETLDDGTPAGGTIIDIVAVDDFTLQFTFAGPDCNAINEIFGITVPSHIYDRDFGDDLAAMNEDPRYIPLSDPADPFSQVTFAPWTDFELIPGERYSFLPDQSFPDTQVGYVVPEQYVVLNLPNGDVSLERFRAGELTLEGIPGVNQQEFRDMAAAGEFQIYEFNRQGYVFYAFNHADPANPLPAFDEEGNYVEQLPHPVLGDKLVRQAVVTAVDMDTIIASFLGGAAVPVGIPSIPASWDWNPDLRYALDIERSMELLDEAGWVMGDGEFRVCESCAYLATDPSYAGTEMSIVLNASAGGTEDSNRMVEFIAQSLRDIGINASVDFLDWGSAFLPELQGQTFDMAILAWSLGLPLDPDNIQIFGLEADVPGSGFNFGSYHNEMVDQMYRDARNPELTNGCDFDARKAIYDEINQVLFDELPYMFMYSNLSMTAAQPWLRNWDPAPFSRSWNEDGWDLSLAPTE